MHSTYGIEYFPLVGLIFVYEEVVVFYVTV